MQLDWRLKSAAFRVLDMLPSSLLYAAQRHITNGFYEIDEISPHWEYHKSALEEAGAKRVLEFGAGRRLDQALFLSTLGIEQTVTDIAPIVDLRLVNSAIRDLKRLGVLKVAREVAHERKLKSIYRINYKAPVDLRRTDFPDASFDACVSSSVLEHIPAKDIPAILAELKRIIRPGGIISARTDYSDHYSRTDRNITEVNHLQYSDRLWRWHSPGNHYQNRLRHGHFRKLAKDAGFETVHDEPRTPMRNGRIPSATIC
jgi:SAM-dependent methyltransferase